VIDVSDVKWIKVSTEIFSDEKIVFLRGMPNGDSLFTLWVFLLVLAGKTNDSGLIYFKPGVPYTSQMLSMISNIPVSSIELALKTMQDFEMIEVNDNGLIILNWEKHQNIKGLEQIKEQTRKRVQRHREKQKALASNVTCNVTRNANTPDVTHLDIELDIDKERDIEEDKSSSRQKSDEVMRIPFEKLVDLYHSICTSLPRIRKLTSKRKSYVKARWKENPDMQFWTEFFQRVENSDFLSGRLEPKGNRDRPFKADLEWITKEENYIKILEGKYDNREEVMNADNREIIENIRRLAAKQRNINGS
jgi:predicted phage replisome organizer